MQLVQKSFIIHEWYYLHVIAVRPGWFLFHIKTGDGYTTMLIIRSTKNPIYNFTKLKCSH